LIIASARITLALLALALSACATHAVHRHDDVPLIVVSIDGYRADYRQRHLSPTLDALARDGVQAAALRPAFPTLTYPNHYTLVTGLLPDHHGIVDNAMDDPVLGHFSPGNRAATEDGRWWDQAEPIWVTAEKQGVRSASVFWPGTAAMIHDRRPSLWQAIDPKVTPDARVDQVLAWLDLPEQQRPRLMFLYFEQADSAAHAHGPDSPEVDAALRSVDAALARLVDGLRQRDRYRKTNLVVVSDHGMAATSPQRMILLDQLVPPNEITVVSSLVLAGLAPKPGYEADVERILLQPQAHMQCWRKDQIPAHLHYGKNPRIPPIVCLAEPGWMISTTEAETKRGHAYLGEHGYDNDDPEMQALFVAHGPGFRSGREVQNLDNVDIYPMLAHLLGIEAKPNDGSLRGTRELLAR